MIESRTTTAKSLFGPHQIHAGHSDNSDTREFEIWLDRQLNILVGRWMDFASPGSTADFDSRKCR